MSASAIEGLAPSTLWKRFYEISQIPRPSKSEERIRLYLRNFAGQNNLSMKEDEAGNVVILISPTPGFEKIPTIVLQSHVDMVCEKNKDTVHDFLNDPIKLVRDGEWIKADGTTLGADNGIGAAAALALINDDDFEHGPLELLFTVDEETGLTGVNSLQNNFITGKTLLNLDTEEDGAFYVGCAGGMDTVGTYKIENDKIVNGYQPFTLAISGLLGGHSGINIADHRANAIKLFGILLDRLSGFYYQLASISGGSKRNAIPREAEAVIFMNPDFESKAREIINEFSLESIIEFKNAEANIKVTFEKKDDLTLEIKSVFNNSFREKIINVILSMPHGVVSMSPEIPGLVETSTNLATILCEGEELKIGTSQRSSIEIFKKNIARTVRAVFELSGAAVKVGDGYPGWQPNMSSEVLKLSKQVYSEMFSKTPEIKAVHAGLECGILADKYPGIDMVSFGPTIEGAHSPDERVKIQDVEKFYRLLKGILSEIANKK
ncbi:MAG: aminoacyl-histidine dipeptidase [Ignavibacteriales bacterium]|nr:aminoacyl-histidine dipeptidase [Ignavibacteriales bacterium]